MKSGTKTLAKDRTAPSSAFDVRKGDNDVRDGPDSEMRAATPLGATYCRGVAFERIGGACGK